MSAAIIIPARYGSSRLPGKPLALICGKPLIQHVYERASTTRGQSTVIIATDDQRIFDAVRAFGGVAIMTSLSHASGTDRIAEAAATLPHDLIINVQGDEPLIDPRVIELVIALLDDPRADISTAACPITDDREARDPNAVKVALSLEGFALYFSRSPIPYHRDLWATPADASASTGARLFKHLGIYGYRRAALMKFSALPPSPLEQAEKLEQLRALEHGMTIKVGITNYQSQGVDTPEDLERVRKCISTSS